MRKAPQQLKCVCVHCDEFIHYPVEKVGQVAECPNCKQKSRLPPPPEPSQPATKTPKPRQPPVQTSPSRWIFIAVAVGLFALAAVLVPSTLRRLRPAPVDQNIPATHTDLPPPVVKRARSLNDLKIGSFSLQPLPGTDSRMAAGDIQNVSETVHQGIKVELEVRDAQGLKIGTLDAFINELDAHATWHVLARTSDPRAATVRVAGIKEEP
jgi:hypothetical protein